MDIETIYHLSEKEQHMLSWILYKDFDSLPITTVSRWTITTAKRHHHSYLAITLCTVSIGLTCTLILGPPNRAWLYTTVAVGFN